MLKMQRGNRHILLFACVFTLQTLVTYGQKTFTYYTYEAVLDTVEQLGKRYPGLVRVFDAEKEFNLPSPHTCGGVLGSRCRTPMLHITNFDTFSKDEEETRPEVFFSGEIHGNERVGTQTLMELAIFLLETYAQDNSESPYYGKRNPWVVKLVNERSIFLSPITNSLGYYQNVREEQGIDPNRDYPVDDDPHGCMQTMASRFINELFIRHMFQISLTYHGGMQAIAYEWGTLTHRRSQVVSPDDTSQQAMGSMMSAFAGPFPAHNYPHGRLGDLVYPVHGGMEDWAYAASWEQNPKNKPCTVNRYGSYPESKTKYTEDQLRDINILIETSDDKQPRESTLGSSLTLLSPGGDGDGHVPRNIRLALLVIDLVQPYLEWAIPLQQPRKSAYEASHRVAPQTFFPNDTASCDAPEWSSNPLQFFFPDDKSGSVGMSVSAAKRSVRLAWHVGGASTVDGTQLLVGKWDPERHAEAAGFGWTSEELKSEFGLISDPVGSEDADGKFQKTELQTGLARWAGGNREGRAVKGNVFQGEDLHYPSGLEMDLEEWPYQPRWQACVQLPEDPGEYFVIARAQVDSIWAKNLAKNDPTPNLPPQSHVVNARTNPSWDRSNAGHRVRGRLDWYSKPIRITVAKDSLHEGTINEKETTPEQEHPRDRTVSPGGGSLNENQFASDQENRGRGFFIAGFITSIIVNYFRNRN